MTTHVALLRGINVGTAKRVAMADLRALVEGLGYGDVRTLLNSGNVVFTAAASTRLGPRIEQALLARTGVSARVTIVNASALAQVVAKNSLARIADNPSRLMVSFLFDPKARALLAPLARRDWGEERLALGPGVAYAWCPIGTIESPLSKALAKSLGDGLTTRNWATVLKLHAMAGERASRGARRAG